MLLFKGAFFRKDPCARTATRVLLRRRTLVGGESFGKGTFPPLGGTLVAGEGRPTGGAIWAQGRGEPIILFLIGSEYNLVRSGISQ